MESPSTFPGLEELVDLGSGNQVDMRPTLLRVLTDLYLQRPAHTAEDERYYTELALRLIEATDLAARAALAERLASYPSAPHAVIERLARDKIEVAAPILEHSRCLTASDLESIAAAHGVCKRRGRRVASRRLKLPNCRSCSTQQAQRSAD
jgi:uncharacterized protein (DUF2336 family)